MAKNVITISATISKFTAAPLGIRKKRKVPAYARVSTDRDEQLTSYEAQVDYYTNYIKGRNDWEFVAVYADEGITGCNTTHRDGFNYMVEDALVGRIDLIITKSVSRFARNTVDSLTTIRKLKGSGTECYFEKENIWTFDGKGELLLTIMSSLAQEENRSISENCTWGQRKRFQDGKVTVPFKRFLGYDRGEVPQYYVEGNHEAVIPLAQFDRVQKEMQRRFGGTDRHDYVSIFSSKIRCGDCSSFYGSKVWHSNDKYRRVIWRCNHKYDDGKQCFTPHLDEETIKALYLKALWILGEERDEIIATFDAIKDEIYDTTELEAKSKGIGAKLKGSRQNQKV